MAGINGWLEDEMYQQYRHDRSIVDESWKRVFEQEEGSRPAVSRAPRSNMQTSSTRQDGAGASGELQPLRGAAARIVENMEVSLGVPMATSQRTIPVKVVDENRRIINQHLTLVGKNKVSYTHLIGWAIVRALAAYPHLNSAYEERDGEPFRRVPAQVNLGIAVDVAGKDGARCWCRTSRTPAA